MQLLRKFLNLNLQWNVLGIKGKDEAIRIRQDDTDLQLSFFSADLASIETSEQAICAAGSLIKVAV